MARRRNPMARRRNPPEYQLYEQQQRLRGLEGVPRNATEQCWHPLGCEGTMKPRPRTQHFDADGRASVIQVCSACGLQGVYYWTWTKMPPAENPDYDR